MYEHEPLALFIPGRPALLNAERSSHWRSRAEQTRHTRNEARLLWRQAGKGKQLRRVKVEVYPTYAKGRLPDTGACFPSVKAIIDGAVDTRLLLNDTPDIVTYLGFHRPMIDKERGDGVMVVMTGIEEDSPWAT